MQIDLIDNLVPMEMVMAKMLLTIQEVLPKEGYKNHLLIEKVDSKLNHTKKSHDPSTT